ncbi:MULTISPECIES: hypothetical protein [Thalassospira]|uniref:Uncharacterized protein n=3 Tax=Thalassospira TaxID=168934 RepID=A0A367V0P8_9PROT|nr:MULTISPECIES: hypothetical protein [Thalassospira]OAZ07649.1 hypothetical protein TH4_21020 [Thalassospira tepidiphila MCCC 1A03514]RCK03471.1 hypothetical protein TH5_25315 [Thalassospira xianhensis MCCC 1A02616]RCK18758.1 hypothetical protein TH6_20720 [Thalassospira profundimaris]
MKSQMIIAGLIRRSGTSKKTGNQYDFWTATVLNKPIIQGVTAAAHGFDASEMSCDPAVAMTLRDSKFPVTCDAQLRLDRDNKAIIEVATPTTQKAVAA